MGGGTVTKYIKPVTTPPLTSWGYYPSGGRHRALDYPAPTGTPFRCAANGVVTVASWSSTGFGNHVRVKFDDGNTCIYGHLSRYIVKVGQRVSAGQIIGYIGSTGNSTGPHLHMEVRRYSYDPLSAWDFTSRLVNYGTSTTTTTADEDFDMSTEQYQTILNLLAKYDANNQRRADANAAKLDELKVRVDKVDEAVWKTPVLRDGVNVPVIQEVADTKSLGRRILAALGLSQS